MTTDELMTQACPVIRDNGWAYYFVPDTEARGRELGLDLLQFYFLGRGGVLGDVEPAVVTSAFGYFEPTLVERVWGTARQVVAPQEAASAHFECCARLGRARLGDMVGLDSFVAAAGAVNGAADPIGLPLYAGFKARPLADDLPGRAMQLVSLLREFRGGAHLVAVRASGLDAKTAHFVKRPGDIAMFGWSDEDPPLTGSTQRQAMAAAESLTDALVRPAFAVLDEAGARALISGVGSIAAALAA